MPRLMALAEGYLGSLAESCLQWISLGTANRIEQIPFWTLLSSFIQAFTSVLQHVVVLVARSRYVFVIITSETYIDPCPSFNFIKGCIDGVVSLPEFPNAIATMPLQCHWLSEKNTISDQHPRYPPLGFLAAIVINLSSQCRSEMTEWPA
jgi:hypothetical protein